MALALGPSTRDAALAFGEVEEGSVEAIRAPTGVVVLALGASAVGRCSKAALWSCKRDRGGALLMGEEKEEELAQEEMPEPLPADVPVETVITSEALEAPEIWIAYWIMRRKN
ncbi:hypothetical protein B296_00045612 [Ensete ventricosum]|uniref:Uncharacterized protein n=1 Tax=Ensete ventricosum TaxID=4639 RepID=A0A426Z6U6_ENSVE|nr:hypothetical protein B296_00045612 [Ensete ventricosum]